MFVSILRNSLFISLLLMVSITLSGCNVDFGAILSGLKNVVGNLSQNLGGFIDKGIGMAKDFIGKAKEFVTPILDKGKEIYDKVKPIAEKVKDGFDKAQNIVNKVQDAGNAISDFGKQMKEGGNDAIGNRIDNNAPTSEQVPARDDEDAVITIRPEGNATASANVAANATASAAVNSLMTPAEREAVTKSVTTNVNQISAAVDNLSRNLKQMKISDAERKATEEKINKLRDSLKAVLKDPTSKEAQRQLKAAKGDVDSLAATAQKYADLAKGTIESVKNTVSGLENSFNSIKDSFSSVFNK